MGINPVLRPSFSSDSRTCVKCGQSLDSSEFLQSNSVLSHDGLSHICNQCICEILEANGYSWHDVDRMCQALNIPFIPKEFEKIHSINETNPFIVYAKMFDCDEYAHLQWEEYYQEFKKLEEAKAIESELPGLAEEEIKLLKEKWGARYDEDELRYLESLYQGLIKSQNVIGAVQDDQGLKLCRISLEIDHLIAEGESPDKLFSSYEKLTKIANFTPKNARNPNDFDSIGEIFKWEEKRGWKNKFYVDESKDIVDETIKNMQNFNQKLYINESGIGEDITHRIEALKASRDLETYYDTPEGVKFDEFDNDGYNEWEEMDDEEFEVMQDG